MLGTVALSLCLSGIARAQSSPSRIPDAPKPAAPMVQATLRNTATTAAQDTATETVRNSAPAGTISLYTVIDLALRNSKKVQIAEAEEQTARGAWHETRDVYIPNFALGSGLGYSYGFPLGTPNIFNVTSTSLLFSFSQRDYIRSAHAADKAALLRLQDTRQQIILETTLDYVDLAKTLSQIDALNQASADADKLVSIVNDRMRAGLESHMSLTRAQLSEAQIELHQVQMEDHADQLRQSLTGLTGLDPTLIDPAAASIPPLPDLNVPSLLKTIAPSPAVLAANATADSKTYAAWGDKRQNYRPTVNFVMQYQRFSTFNGYQNYYVTPPSGKFPLNNLGVGIQAIWPLFDRSRADKAAESKAEAERARHEAELTHIQFDAENLALYHSLRELEMQEKVAELQQQLTQDTLNATLAQMNSASTDTNGVPVTPQQAEQSRVNERTSYVDLQDAQFSVTRVKLNLLNAVGELEDWVKDAASLSGSH